MVSPFAHGNWMMPNTGALRLRYAHFAADLAEDNDPKVLLGPLPGFNPSQPFALKSASGS